MQCPRGRSLPSWRIASKNGRPSMSPTVPPISTSTKSTSSLPSRTNSLMALVTCGITCTVRAEIVAAPLLGDDVLVDAAGGDVVGLARRTAGEALVVAEVEIGLRAVVGDEDLAVLIRAHRARIDVEIGVELAQPDRVAARLQERAEGRRRQTLAERGNHAAGDEDVPRHGNLRLTPFESIRERKRAVPPICSQARRNGTARKRKGPANRPLEALSLARLSAAAAGAPGAGAVGAPCSCRCSWSSSEPPARRACARRALAGSAAAPVEDRTSARAACRRAPSARCW